MEDKRFSHIANDPKFRRIPKAQTKVKIDRRFQSMFTDKKFQVKYTTDKRGRPVKHHSREDLKRYYEVSSEDDSESSENESDSEAKRLQPGKFVKAPKSEESDDQESSDSETDGEDDKEENENSIDVIHQSDKKLPDHVKKKIRDLNIDYARGEQRLFSDSSSDDEETDDEISESEEIDHRWGELHADAPQTEEATSRLAACNLDWDRIRAVDLLVLFNSFLPPGGVVHSVIIYPSEFGKQRLKEEEVKGPIELVEAKKEEQNNDESEEGSKYHMEKLRQYQLNRLKYYYAVITFDSANSADKIYTECDGMEYESSATKMDLRFIPDEMTFDDTPKESSVKLPEKYEPRFFTTTALQQAKVELTWDETNPERLEIAEKISSGKMEDISKKDLQNYLAGSSSEEELSENENNNNSDSEESQSGNMIDKYKALLLDFQDQDEKKKNKDFEMEISWGTELKEKTDQLVKERLENKEERTPFEKYLDKRKEKRKERKALSKKSKEQDNSEDSDIPSDIDMNDPYFAEEFNNPEFKKKSNKKKDKKDLNADTEQDEQRQGELDLLLMNGDENDQKKHFSLKKIQDKESESKNKKKKKKNKSNDKNEQDDEDDFQINVDDKRFSALFTSHHFNIDPTDPHYKKTKGTEALIQEKIKRRKEETQDNEKTKKVKKEEDKSKNKNVELNMLVKSVKRKAEAFRNK